MEAPSEEAIASRLRQILEAADLSVITLKDVRNQLQKEMGVDLGSKKAFIRQQIDIFMQEQQQPEEQSAQSDVEDHQSEEEQEEGECEAEAESDGNVDEEQQDSKRLQAKIKRAMKESMPQKKKRRGPGPGKGFQKICQLSPELEAVIGQPQVPRTQVVKILWEYIRNNNLQVPENRRKIRCDEALKKIFNVDQVEMFAMQKKLTKHLIPLDELDYVNAQAKAEEKKAKQDEEDNEEMQEDRPEPGTKAARRLKRKERKEKEEQKVAKRTKKDSTSEAKSEKPKKPKGFAVPVRISPELKEFLGTNENELPRQEVTKHMWEYIKTNQLQDPSNKKFILCDDKLHKLFNCEKFSGFGDMPKLLKPHYLTNEDAS